ncbi:MAG: hypothetical protein KGR26_16640 [Cyanobacteria bacterium REEB65]|nr:hypothetical protein [Cyanobacteria bacterium REEB65]
MATTLLLDRDNWDLCLDATGNIAVAAEPYSMEQDVASECRVFEGECYYDTTRGVPYFNSVLGQMQPIQILKEKLIAAAELVPGVNDATAYLTGPVDRALSGQVQFKDGTVNL